MSPKSSGGSGGGKGDAFEAAILVSMFEKVTQTQIRLTTKMDMLCTELRKNTEATNKLLNHLSGIPSCLDKIKGTIGLMKWGLIPVILSLTGLICFLAAQVARR